jgi:hypothetical protein
MPVRRNNGTHGVEECAMRFKALNFRRFYWAF